MKNIDLNDMKELKVAVSHLMDNPEILKECKKESQESLNIALHNAGVDAVCGKTINSSRYIEKAVIETYINSLVDAVCLYMEDGTDAIFTTNNPLFPHAREVYNSLDEKNNKLEDNESNDSQTDVSESVETTSDSNGVCSGESKYEYLKTLVPRLLKSSLKVVGQFTGKDMNLSFNKEAFYNNQFETIILHQLYRILTTPEHLAPGVLELLKDIDISDTSEEIKESEPTKKYEIETNSCVILEGVTLHRIRALKSFGRVQKGDLGGFIEKEDNLSQEGNCWVYGDAKVYGNAKVCDNAIVKDYATVSGSAYIRNKAYVSSFAKVYDNADVCDESIVGGSCLVHGDTMVRDKAAIIDNSELCNNAVLKNDIIIRGDSYIGSVNDYIVVPIKDDDGNTSTLTFSKKFSRVPTLLVYSESIPPMNLGDFALRLDVMESNNGNKADDYVLSCRKAVELAKIVLLP